MQGMRFLLLGEDGRPINHGIIAQKVTEERYLCTFFRNPQVSRLCHVDEISTWNLFPTDDMMNQFIATLTANNPPPTPEPPAEPPGGEKPPVKKVPIKKKVGKKKPNAKTKR